ncbi:hypothetical protein BDV32DRAFT_122604 [Aspergillus pseudonomiae]|nr:hypothetical protein BDV32DRAFT_122604 [Aspergillus pseudonomiae]
MSLYVPRQLRSISQRGILVKEEHCIPDSTGKYANFDAPVDSAENGSSMHLLNTPPRNPAQLPAGHQTNRGKNSTKDPEEVLC